MSLTPQASFQQRQHRWPGVAWQLQRAGQLAKSLPMLTLGINAAFHDCSACIVRDGMVLAAAEEERFTRIKHGKRPVPFSVWQLPFYAIDYCLREAGAVLTDLDHVAYAYDPWLQLSHGRATIALPLQPSATPARDNASPWEPLALSYVVNAPRQLAGGAPYHLRERFSGATADGPYRWHFVEHHRAHEASAFLAAPFDDCAVLTIDGRGEQATASYGLYRDGHYRRLRQINLPHSLGLLYEAVTTHLGFLHASDEYKVMALASYGRPVYTPQLSRQVRWCGDGEIQISPVDCAALFGPARQRGAQLQQRHFDIAYSLQQVLEDTVLTMANWLYDATQSPHLALAGGVALNCVMNAKLRDRGPWKQVWVQPAAGDAGTALGAALWIDAQQRENGAQRRWQMNHALLGPAFSEQEIEALLVQAQLPWRRPRDLAADTAALLAQGKVIGWFQQRMEFGPRALGARSILASPLDAGMQARLNLIKDREDFRPVAPVVLNEEASNWFDGARDAPFMTFVYRVRADHAARIPAVRHVDGTARVQTVTREQNPALYALLQAFKTLTGVPVLVNTSFNTRGEPIVCTPRDALESFCTTPLDALVIGPFIVDKSDWAQKR